MSSEEEVPANADEQPTSDETKPEAANTPLNSKWTLWFDNPRLAPPGADWKENLTIAGHFDSIESFWRVFNNVKPARDIGMNSNYSVFRYGIEPSWEDKRNCEGGKFVYTLQKKESKGGRLEEVWLYSVLAAIGETMDPNGNTVNGVVVSLRKSQDRVALWLGTSDKKACVHAGQRWKKVLNLEKTFLRYQTHKDAAASGRSFRNEVHFEV